MLLARGVHQTLTPDTAQNVCSWARQCAAYYPSVACSWQHTWLCSPFPLLRTEKLHFPDFSAADACLLLRRQLEREYGLELSPEADAALPELMREVRRLRRPACVICTLIPQPAPLRPR